jgi:2-keto-4-pentenoate hydratase/2-oxohepta-3-ene-1,7-dioic acid hydratase in catechol pathway
MKIARFDDGRLGIVEGDEILDVSAVLEALPARRWPLPRGDDFIAHLPALAPAIEAAAAAGAPRRRLDAVTLLSPVANPGKIIAAPVNYHAHVDESNVDEMLHHGGEIHPIDRYALFLKATSALVGPGEGIVVDRPDRRTDHEIELALVIGSGGRNIAAANALDHVAGYTMGLDITIRGTEDRSYRKSLDSFAVLGPWLVTADEFGDPSDVTIALEVNGEGRQKANTRDLIWSIPKIIEVASHAYTLDPGDVIYTGTPDGVGPIAPGDTITARIDRIGEMRVAVRGGREERR